MYTNHDVNCSNHYQLQLRSLLEIIVVDDGSTDNSMDVLEDFKGKICIIRKPNGGHVEAVNTGFLQSKSDLCLFLDADDRLYPDCLKEVAVAWTVNDIKLQFRLDTIDEDAINQRMPFPYFPADLTPEEVRRRSFETGVYPWTVSSGCVFSRAFLVQLLPIDSTEIYRSPDGYLSKVAPLFGDVRSINKVLGAYRVHGTNAWAQSREKLNIAPIAQWVKFDRVLHEKFEALARKRGISVVSAQNVRSVQQCEYRLILKRLYHDGYPYRDETQFSLLRICVEAAMRERGISILGRLFWILWFGFLLISPAGTVSHVYRLIRAQSGRGSVTKFIVRISRQFGR
jgi:glycosyltransferase involved in cell wall biosynthesis